MPEQRNYIQDLEGRTLGIYQVRRKLGEGGMGAVYRAYDPLLDREVAIKVLPAEYARDRSYIQRFEREVRALARLRHPNLVHIYTVGEDAGIQYFAMEFIEGETLADYMRQRDRLSIEEALRIGSQVLSALHSIHRLGITHRDIKASNIMIDGNGRAVLMDFGLAKDRAQDGLTTVGTVLGTPEYMSPEQAQGEEVTPQSDLYSFGVLMYEMLGGRLPFIGGNVLTILRGHLEEKPPDLGKLRGDLPKRLVRIVHRALEKQPADRYASLAYMARDLLEVYSEPALKDIAGDAADAVTVHLKPPPSRRRRLEMAVLGLGVLVLVVGVFVILATIGGPPPPAIPPTPEDTGGAELPAPQPVELHMRGGSVVSGRLVSIEQRPEGPVLIYRTDAGDEHVVALGRVDSIVYPGR